jgi:predicted ribosomally synthesized peptide with SipW-like signal peptide
MAEEFRLSRRTVLASLGAIGAASAGAGVGTSAFFSDQETFENNQFTAGTLDLKVGWQEHYSDWRDETDDDPYPGAETTYARMPATDEDLDVFLPPGPEQSNAQPIELVFTDPVGDDGGTDSRPDQADGGRQFLRNTKQSDVNGGLYGGPTDLCETDADVEDQPLIELSDVKPGDFGFAYFRLRLCDNPGYLWLTGGLESASENGVTEAEADDPDERDDVVELLDEIQIAYGVGTTDDLAPEVSPDASPNPQLDGSGTQFTTQSTLREFLTAVSSGSGIPLEGDIGASEGGGTGRPCFSGATDHYVSVFWWLPIDHGNQVQSDSVTFDLGFYTEQCRHNGGEGVERTNFATDFDYNEDPTDHGWAQVGDADDSLHVANSEICATGSGEFPFGGLNATFTRPISVSTTEPFETTFSGVRNEEQYYGLRMFFSTASSVTQAFPSNSGGIMLLVRQLRFNDVFVYEFDDTGDFVEGTKVAPSHNGNHNDIVLEQSGGEQGLSVQYGSDPTVTIDGNSVTNFNYLTVRFDGDKQAIDAISVRQPPSD